MNLNIGLTNFLGIETSTSEIIYNAHRFSYNFLREVRDAIGSQIPKFYSVFGVGISPRDNHVVVRLACANHIPKVVEYLSSLSLFHEEAVKFVVEENNIEEMSRPINAGDRIWSVYRRLFGMNSNGRDGTISAMAICNRSGARGVITNAHVARPSDHHSTHGNSLTSNVIGDARQYVWGGIGDATFVELRHTNLWQFTPSARHGNIIIPTTYQIASRCEIVQGLPVAKFGATTGRTEGHVSLVGQIFTIGDRVFYDQILHTAYARRGDSGSPLFTIDSHGRHILIGIVSHSDTANGTPGFAGKVPNIAQALDVTIVASKTSRLSVPNGYVAWHQPTFQTPANSSGRVSDTRPFDGEEHTFFYTRTSNTSNRQGYFYFQLNQEVIVQRIEIEVECIFAGDSAFNRRRRDFQIYVNGQTGHSPGSPNRGAFEVASGNGRHTLGRNFNRPMNHFRLAMTVRLAEIRVYSVRIIALQPIPTGMEVWRQPTWQTPTNTYGTITSHPAHNYCIFGVRAFDRNPNTYYSAENRFGEVRLNLFHDINLQRIEVVASARSNSGNNVAAMQIYLDGYNRGTGGVTFTIPRRSDNVIERHSFVFYSKVPLARRIQVRMLATNALIRLHEVNITAFVPINVWHQPEWINNSTTSCGGNHGTVTYNPHSVNRPPTHPYRAFNRSNLATRVPVASWLNLNLNYSINVYTVQVQFRTVANNPNVPAVGAVQASVGDRTISEWNLPANNVVRTLEFNFHGQNTNTIRVYAGVYHAVMYVYEVRVVATR